MNDNTNDNNIPTHPPWPAVRTFLPVADVHSAAARVAVEQLVLGLLHCAPEECSTWEAAGGAVVRVPVVTQSDLTCLMRIAWQMISDQTVDRELERDAQTWTWWPCPRTQCTRSPRLRCPTLSSVRCLPSRSAACDTCYLDILDNVDTDLVLCTIRVVRQDNLCPAHIGLGAYC